VSVAGSTRRGAQPENVASRRFSALGKSRLERPLAALRAGAPTLC
jgi:hypothetical protein